MRYSPRGALNQGPTVFPFQTIRSRVKDMLTTKTPESRLAPSRVHTKQQPTVNLKNIRKLIEQSGRKFVSVIYVKTHLNRFNFRSTTQLHGVTDRETINTKNMSRIASADN